MFTTSPRQAVLNSLKICLMLGLLLLPFAATAAPTFALQKNAAPVSQGGNQDNNVVVLQEVQNPDGTTTVTVRIYASPSAPNAPAASYSMSKDTYIASGNPTNNYGSDYRLGIGYNSNSSLGALGALRMLLQFDLSSIPAYANVTNATIHIYQYAVSGISNMGFQAQYAVRSWDEYSTTWDNANNIGGAKLPIGNFPDTIGWLSANATNLFKTWVSGQEPNYGLILTGYEDPVSHSSRWFYSRNYGTARPYVDITYTTGCSYTTNPTSYVYSLPATSPNAFTVSWTGTAYTPPGCTANGIASYIVWYQVNGGDFIKWRDGVPYTSDTFNAASLGIGNGALVGFRSQAIDYYGNKTPAGNATAATTINAVNPTAAMYALPVWTTTPTFVVKWTGNAQGGPAITSYNFEVNVNNGGWTRLLSNTPQTSYQYSGATGNNYQFRTQASNNYGTSFGPWSETTGTTIDTTTPSTTMTPLDQYTTSTAFWVWWTGSDTGSGIAYYNLQYQFNQGAWQTLLSGIPANQPSFYYENAQTGVYGFRVQAVDNAGNTQAWPASAQASTAVLVNPLAVVLPFSPGILQSTAPVTKTFNVSWQAYTPPGTSLTTVTIRYRYNTGSGWTGWALWPLSPFPATQTIAPFNWFDMHLPDEATYQFQATAANDLNQPPYELPSQYWASMIVDMHDRYTLVYLPVITYNAP